MSLKDFEKYLIRIDDALQTCACDIAFTILEKFCNEEECRNLMKKSILEKFENLHDEIEKFSCWQLFEIINYQGKGKEFFFEKEVFYSLYRVQINFIRHVEDEIKLRISIYWKVMEILDGLELRPKDVCKIIAEYCL